MEKSKNKITIILMVFIFVFIVSVVYAITSGILVFGGTANFSTVIDMHIKDAIIIDDGLGGSVSISADMHTLSFNVVLGELGNSKTVQFYLKNVGNKPAILGSLSTTEPAVDSGVNVYWPTLDDIVFAAGQTRGPYEIVILRDSVEYFEEDSIDFSARINWSQYIPTP